VITQLQKGDTVYVTRVAYHTLSDVAKNCTRLTVEHATPKAILLSAGEDQQWFPKRILTDANVPGVYLLPKWFDLTTRWKVRCGSPTPG